MAEVEDVVVNVPCTEHYPQFKTLDDVVGFDTEYYHLDFKSLKTINSKLFLDKYSTGTPAFVSMGTYGQVYRSESSEGVFAVKKFVMINGYNEPHRFYQNNCMEVVILKSVNHPNVVRLLDASVVDGYLHAAFDYYENDISRFNFRHLQRHHRNWRLLAMKHIRMRSPTSTASSSSTATSSPATSSTECFQQSQARNTSTLRSATSALRSTAKGSTVQSLSTQR